MQDIVSRLRHTWPPFSQPPRFEVIAAQRQSTVPFNKGRAIAIRTSRATSRVFFACRSGCMTRKVGSIDPRAEAKKRSHSLRYSDKETHTRGRSFHETHERRFLLPKVAHLIHSPPWPLRPLLAGIRPLPLGDDGQTAPSYFSLFKPQTQRCVNVDISNSFSLYITYELKLFMSYRVKKYVKHVKALSDPSP